MQQMKHVSQTNQKTFELVLTAILIALVFICAFLINIKLPIKANGGLVHLGTAMMFIAAILFGPKKGAYAGALGMGLFDLFGGWVIWAPITIVARGLQGYIVGKIAWAKGKKGRSLTFNIVGTIISMPVMIAVYYVGEALLYNSWVAPLASIPGDILQNVVGLLIAIPVCKMIVHIPYFQKKFH